MKRTASKPISHRIAALYKKWIVSRPNGNCQVLFALTELDDFVDEIIAETLSVLREKIPKKRRIGKHDGFSVGWNSLRMDIMQLLKNKETVEYVSKKQVDSLTEKKV